MTPEILKSLSDLSVAALAIVALLFIVVRQLQLFDRMEQRQGERHTEQIKVMSGLKETISDLKNVYLTHHK